MNYLGHFVYNHDVCGIDREPYFVLGVALPDLWPRFSRRRRIRWDSVRAADSPNRVALQIREGLLNHVRIDQRFHTSRSFMQWQRELKTVAARDMPRSATLDFLVHISIELVLDQRLVLERPEVAKEFYVHLALCDADAAETHVGRIASVDTTGLAGEIRGFVERRFLPNFARSENLVRVVRYIFGLTTAKPLPDDNLIRTSIDAARGIVKPQDLWTELSREPGGSVT